MINIILIMFYDLIHLSVIKDMKNIVYCLHNILFPILIICFHGRRFSKSAAIHILTESLMGRGEGRTLLRYYTIIITVGDENYANLCMRNYSSAVVEGRFGFGS